MKKLIILLAVIITILSLNKNEQIIIPKEAIRFRVIASSNTPTDQAIKQLVVHNLTKDLKNLDLSPQNLEKAREQIKKGIPTFQETIEKTLRDESLPTVYKIDYGNNYFPRKTYQNVVYDSGEYESLVVTLGDGKGDNFWCVLFPPLCLLEGKENQDSDVEYTSFIKELIAKYF